MMVSVIHSIQQSLSGFKSISVSFIIGAGLLLVKMEGSRLFLCLYMAVSIMGSFSTSSSTHLASTMSILGVTGTSMSGSTGKISQMVSSMP